MSEPRLAFVAVLVALAAAVPVATGSTTTARSLTSPTGLQSFLLRAGKLPAADAEQATQFPRTPSFAWTPVRGAERYHFQLATSPSFGDDKVVWSSTTLRSPAATVPVSLPWLPAGSKPSLYWRVRAAGSGDVSSWSQPAGFQLQPDAAPKTVSVGFRGYVRWASVRGATGYQVWFVNRNKVVSTTTTVADLRDYVGPGSPTKAVWRVRAERRTFGSAKAVLPAVSYGPWSDATTTPVAFDRSALLTTVSEGVGPKAPRPEHRLLPVFLFPAKDAAELHHVYIASDTACTDVVFNSAIVRGSAFAPRSSQFAKGSQTLTAVNDGPVFAKSGRAIRPTEAPTGSGPDASARIDLPDTMADGRYYWTVVPVQRGANGSYHDLASAEESCRSKKASFSKHAAEPTLGGREAPFVTGLSPIGNLFAPSTNPGRFYGFPVVAWKPASGATRYEVQWSRSRSPWRTKGSLKTYATSATLPLTPGAWYFRVRGLDESISGEQALGWSAGERVRISIPIFSVERS